MSAKSDGKLVGLITGGSMGSDPFDPTSWSGSSKSLFEECQRQQLLHRAFGLSLPRWKFAVIAGRRFHPTREVWRRRVFSSVAYRSSLENVLKERAERTDVNYPILQLGAYVNAARAYGRNANVFSYQDGNNVEYINSGFAPAAIATDTRLNQACFSFEQEVANSMRAVFTTSRYLATSFIEQYRIPSEKVVVVGCGLNMPLPPANIIEQKDYEAKEILFIGKDFQRKGGDALCSAFRLARSKFPTAVLNIVGPKVLPTALASEPGVRHFGFLDREKEDDAVILESLLSRCTLFALPSRYEPFGIAPLEAMAFGIPAIVTNRWALGENVITEVNGFHCGPDDVYKLADIIVDALSDSERLRRLGIQGREKVVREHTWEKVVERIVERTATV